MSIQQQPEPSSVQTRTESHEEQDSITFSDNILKNPRYILVADQSRKNLIKNSLKKP